MVTEAIPATETPVVPESVTPGDAGETQVADAATQEVETFLDSRGKESAESATEPTAEKTPDPVDAELEAAKAAAAQVATEKATAEAKAQIAAEQAQAEVQAAQAAAQRAFAQNYQQRSREAGQEAYQAAIDLGYSEQEAQERGQKAIQRFNSHHADGLKLYEGEARRQAASQLVQGFNDAIASVLDDSERTAFFGPPDAPQTYKAQQDVLKALKDVWQKDRMTPAEVKAHTTKAILDYRRDLESKGLVAGTASGSISESAGAGGRSFASEHDLNVAYNAGTVAHDHYAREYKRLTGREP